MPDMIPVGNTSPFNPQQGVGMLSGILGVQQQRQQLQTGQYLQQSAQANAQQDQQKNREYQALAAFTKNAVSDPSYQMEDGSPNIQKFQEGAMTVAPTYGQDVLGKTTSNFKEAVGVRSAIQKLSQEQNAQASGALKAIASNPNATESDLLDAIEQQRVNNKDPAYNRVLDNLLLTTNRADIPGSAAKASAVLGGYSLTAPSTIDTGAAIQPGATSAFGGAFTPAGAPIPKKLSPQIITQPGTGAPAVVGGATGTNPQPIGPPGTKANASWWNPAPGQSQLLQANTAALAARIQAGNESANTAPQALDALSRARAILDRGTWTGSTFSLFKDLKNTLAGVGFDTGTDANELVKNLARYEATRASGVGNTDAARSLFETGSPNTKVDSQAAKNIITQAMANESANLGYAKSVGSAATPQEAQSKEQQIRGIPNLIEGYEYSLMRSPEEAEQFIQRYGLTKRQIAETRAKMRQQGLL